MIEMIFCPSCSKVTFVKVSSEFECKECKTKFLLDDKLELKIVKHGNLKTSSVLINMLSIPVGFILFFFLVSVFGEHFSKSNLILFSILMVIHPILAAPRELRLSKESFEPLLIELYIAFLKGRLNRYGSMEKIYFYSSFVVFAVGLIILFISII